MRIKGIFGSIFVLSLVFGAMALTANAQRYGSRDWNGYPNWGGSYDLRQTALNAGFNEGTSAGQKDNSRGRRGNYNDFTQYRNANKDYSSRLGDRGLYQRYYRVAFEHGYDAAVGNPPANGGYNGGYKNNGGYNNGNNNNNDWRNRRTLGRNWGQYGNYGGNANFRQTGLNAGYNEGIAQGRKDRNRGPRNLNDFSQYRNANKDYNSREGDISLYQRYYREGFENGYYDGLNGN
jgi:hypothetical protein